MEHYNLIRITNDVYGYSLVLWERLSPSLLLLQQDKLQQIGNLVYEHPHNINTFSYNTFEETEKNIWTQQATNTDVDILLYDLVTKVQVSEHFQAYLQLTDQTFDMYSTSPYIFLFIPWWSYMVMFSCYVLLYSTIVNYPVIKVLKNLFGKTK